MPNSDNRALLESSSRGRSRSKSLRSVGHALMLVGLAATLAGCAFPRKDFASVPDPSVIRLQQQDGVLTALPPDCEPLRQPSQYNTMTDLRMDIAFGCATYTNLSQQARPEDLARPRNYGGQSAETAARAVERHRTGNVTPLMQTSTTDVGD